MSTKSNRGKKAVSCLLSLVMMMPLTMTVLSACGDKTHDENDDGVYTVTFDANGGKLAVGAAETIDTVNGKIEGALPSVEPRTEYDFGGWNIKSDGTGETVTADYVFTKDTTVYAKWTVKGGETSDPDRYVTVDNIRVGLLSDTMVRVEYKGSKGFEDRDTFYVSNRDAVKAPEHTQTVEGSNTVISTANYKVYVPTDATSLNGVRIVSASGDELWRYTGNTTSNVYLPSPSDELKSWYFTDSPRIVPSDYGYSYIEDNTDVLQGWDFDNDAPDCYVFLPDGDYTRFCSDYIQITGKSDMISLQMLGYWDSRWFAYSDETAIGQIQDYLDRGYSIDVLVIDKDWHSDNGIDGVGYQINTELFPNMAEFLEQCHEMGVNIMFNDHPEPVKGTDNLLDDDEVSYRSQKLTMLLSLGLDYWWYDRNWSVALNNIDPDISVFATGMYAYQFVTDEYLESVKGDADYADRALIMGNVDGCLHGRWTYASDISAHKYSIQWTGDINTDTTALAQEIYASVFGGAEVGIPYMSSDLGGHTAAVTDEMYIRWLQYGALSTICRVHCTNVDNIGQDGRMPWLFGETAEEVVHEYVDMRYRLLPLFYSLARENYDTGLPVMRRTDIRYPQYNEASRNDQYLLGDNILVAPFDSAENLNAVPTSWLTTTDGSANGLNATYFGDKNLGTRTKTQIDGTVFFNWEQGGPQGMGADNFSIRWEGNIKIGDKDSRLCFFADDGIRVWIDGQKVVDGWNVYDKMLSTDYYAAGSSHTIKIEYFEAGGGAHCYMYYGEREANGEMTPNTRTVFIPDGTWIDVWSGTRYVGPQTVTVSHGLTTSPIFVREGGVLALAENMKNTSEKDWSKMSLDIYAGTTNTETVLYEDDTKTQAYKDGKFRKTLITNKYADGKFTVTVNAAEGAFTGERAFDTRDWTVRIHLDPEWGNIKNVKINGKNAKGIRSFNKSANSTPFAFEGAALDGKICQFTVEGANVYEKMEITFEFDGPIEQREAPEYDDGASEISVRLENAGDAIDLTDVGDVDWAYFGVDSVDVNARKDTTARFIGDIETYATCSLLSYSKLYAKWTDGEGLLQSARSVTSGLVSQKDFGITFKVDTTKRYYVINLGGQYCIAKLTLRDRAGNAQTVNFGNLNGEFNYRAVIEAKGERASEIQATYAVLVSKPDGTGSPSKVNVSSMYVTTQLKDPVYTDDSSVAVTVKPIADVPDTFDLSSTAEAGLAVADWRHFGATDDAQYISMSGGDAIGKTQFTNPRGFYDYKTAFAWSDGDTVVTENGSHNGTCTDGEITLFFNVTSNTRKILLYTGTWNATNTVRVYNSKYDLIGASQSFSAGGASANKLVEIDVDCDEETTIIVRIVCTNEVSGGNVSLAAVQVLESAE